MSDDIGNIFLDWPTFWAQDRSETEWLIEPVLAKGRGHAIYAYQKTGKSLFLLNLLAHLVTTDNSVMVSYFDYEMSEADVYERLIDMGYGPKTDFSRFHYALLPPIAALDTRNGATQMLSYLDPIQVAHPDLHMVVAIDTMTRAVEGPENDSDTYRSFYRETGSLFKRRGWTWARADHSGKDGGKGQRGSSGKGDDVDVIWRLDKASGGLQLVRDAARMNWIPEKVKLQKVDDPLHFEIVKQLIPDGAYETADLLTNLGISVTLSVAKVRAALSELGVSRSQNILAAAVKLRKQGVTPGVTPPGIAHVTPIAHGRDAIAGNE